MESFTEGIKVYKALGETKRAMIIDMLLCGELCACNILKKFEMSQSTLSHHMKLLCESGLIKSRNKGKWTYYPLDFVGIANAKQFSTQSPPKRITAPVQLEFTQVIQCLYTALLNLIEHRRIISLKGYIRYITVFVDIV